MQADATLTSPHVVIVGAGFGGLYAAKTLGRRSDLRVTLIDCRNHHVFQPLLYQVATAALSPGDIASPVRWILRRQRNVRVLLGEAVHIDVRRRCVVLADGDAVAYDFLIVAAGVRPAYFGHDDWGPRRNILRTLAGQSQRPFRYRDYGNLATVGRNFAVADFGWCRLAGRTAWFLWLVVHILWLIGFRNWLGVLSQWAWASVTYQRSVRLITGKPT